MKNPVQREMKDIMLTIHMYPVINVKTYRLVQERLKLLSVHCFHYFMQDIWSYIA